MAGKHPGATIGCHDYMVIDKKHSESMQNNKYNGAIKTFIVLVIAIGLTGCEQLANPLQRPSLDVKLIGVWTGEYLEQGGTLKTWVQTRNADGTYSIDFSFKESDGTIRSFTESGQWWVKENLFHERSIAETPHPDKYRYTFKEKDCVEFELIESEGYAEEAGTYQFSECLTADSPPAVFGESI